jgi:hypothetical protein
LCMISIGMFVVLHCVFGNSLVVSAYKLQH